MKLAPGRCPTCQLTFDAALGGPEPAFCPVCDTELIPVEKKASPQAPAAAAGPGRGVPSPSASRSTLTGGVTVGVVLLLAGGTALAVHWFDGIDNPDVHSTAPAEVRPPAADPSPAGDPPPANEPPLDLGRLWARPLPPQLLIRPAQPPLLTRPAQPPQPAPVVRPAEPLPVRVNRAIDQGVAYLKKTHQDLAVFPAQGNFDRGLLGLTLLSSGVPARDPLIQKLATSLRQGAPQLVKTYNLSLAILFFDRLNNSSDRDLIETLGLRLAAGQSGKGDWGYDCPALNNREEYLFRAYLGSGAGDVPGPPFTARGAFDSPPSLRELALAPPGVRPKTGRFILADSSNTQFALLALWAARRHGAPVSPALARAARHFRAEQLSDGSWSYRAGVPQSRPSNSCAALIALAVEHGLHVRTSGEIRDAAMLKGLRFLGSTLAQAKQSKLPAWRGFSGVDCNDDLYFLWSLERAAVIYDLRVIGETEWYPWAAEKIVNAQQKDGSWQNAYGAYVDTCFALLVLRRTNFAPDLTAALRGRIPGQDPLPSATPRPGATPPLSATEKPGEGKLGSAIKQVPEGLKGSAVEGPPAK